MAESKTTLKAKLIIVMGVSGCGKSSVARALAKTFHLNYMEADDFHSQEAKALMASGTPLTDEMRAPWITRMCEHLIFLRQQNKDCILAYSGLRKSHRQRFRQLGFNTRYIFLNGDEHLIQSRLNSRENHFMSTELLKSQFSALESPIEEPGVINIHIAGSLSDVIDTCVTAINRASEK